MSLAPALSNALSLSTDSFLKSALVSLLVSSGGYKRTEFFVSYGYGLSVAACAILGLVASGASVQTHATFAQLHALALVAYGVRLVLYCRWRDSLDSYQEVKRRTKEAGGATKAAGTQLIGFHVTCALLYATLYLPSMWALQRLPGTFSSFKRLPQALLAIAYVALGLETVADQQKSKTKIAVPGKLVTRGLYRWCRHPNYFAEVVFWLAVWGAAGAAGVFTSTWQWAVSALGPASILFIIAQATSSQEKQQAKKYAGPEYQHYRSTVPVFVPLSHKLPFFGRGGTAVDKLQ